MRDRRGAPKDELHDFDEVKLPRLSAHQIRFASASEMACAVLLQRHCEWHPHPGATYQIPIGRCLFDFRVGTTFIEWHPINLRNEFLTPLLRHILPLIDRLPKHKKAQTIAAFENEMSAQYIKRRAQILSAHPIFNSFKLAVCFNPEQFVAVVAANALNPVSPDILISEFRKVARRER